MEDYKVRILQPNVPTYRVALYEGLGAACPGRVEVFATDGVGTPNVSQPIKGIRYDYAHPIVKFWKIGWQKGVTTKGLKRGDVLVISGEVQNLSNIWLALRAKFRGIAVVWWGHHRSATSTEGRTKVRLFFARALSDIFLCYTKTGVNYLLERGFKQGRVFATWNTIDEKPIIGAIQKWSHSRLREFQVANKLLDRPLVLVCSALRPKTRLDLLFSAVSDETVRKWNPLVVIIGDGPMREEYMKKVSETGVGRYVRWLGPLRNQEELAPWFLSARVYAYPGAVGLGLIHAMAYGLPVVVHGNSEHQMPEFEAMEDGKTGLTFEENSVADLARKLDYSFSHPEEMKKMGEYAKEKAYSKYSMRQMVSNYCMAIEAAHQIVEKHDC